ncbi:MAG: hypothetical protein JWO23_2715, partial [Solirubrobacterales bacterium]|nr:hypothetical protein [Solirubrobacterales bacterium]
PVKPDDAPVVALAEALLRTYSHLLPRSDAQAADAIAAILVDKPLTETAV